METMYIVAYAHTKVHLPLIAPIKNSNAYSISKQMSRIDITLEDQ